LPRLSAKGRLQPVGQLVAHRRAPVEPLAIGGERLVAYSMKQANVGPGGIDMGRAPPQQHGIEPLDYPVRRSPADDVGSVHP